MLAQKLFHRSLRGDRFGDLVADAPRRVDRGGDGLDAGASHLQAEEIEPDVLQRRDGRGEAFGGELTRGAQLVGNVRAASARLSPPRSNIAS